MKNENLRSKIIGAVTGGLIGLIIAIPPFIMGRRIYHELTADVKAVANAGELGYRMRALYGFDRDQDGQIDKIIEHFPVIGAKHAIPGVATYTPKDKEFRTLLKYFEN